MRLFLTGMLLTSVSCAGEALTNADDAGSLAVTASTTGVNPDPDGYSIILDGLEAKTIGVNDTQTLSNLTTGEHRVKLDSLAQNCAARSGNPRTVTINSGATTTTTFDITCQYQIAFMTERDGDHEIYVMNADGTNPVNLTRNQAYDASPVWSPDGTAIAFASLRGGYEIFVMAADGANEVNLTNNDATDTGPAWSPDGMKIAFATDRDGPLYRSTEVYVMNADGTDPVRLTNADGFDRLPAWSPDGSQIAFEARRSEGLGIYIMNVDGTGVRYLASGSHPAWSPDGTKIAFEAMRLGTLDILVVNTDGTGTTNLTYNPGENPADIRPAWSPDGTRIAFASDIDGNFEIYVMNADGTGLVRLTDHPAEDSEPDWR